MSESVNAPIRIYRTTDLALAAFFKLKRVTLFDHSTINSNGRETIEFHFDDSEGVCRRLELEWQNSEIRIFDSEIRSLKKLGKNRQINDYSKRKTK